MTVNSNEASYTYSKSDDASGTHGNYDFEVIAYDTDNSEIATDSINDIVMDTQSPEISSESPTGATDNDNPNIEASFSDSVSGLQNASISFEGVTSEATGTDAESLSIDSGDYDDLSDGEHTVTYEAYDEAGNSISSSWDFIVDTGYDGDSNPDFWVEDEDGDEVTGDYFNFDEDAELVVDFGDADSETTTTVTCVIDGVDVDDFNVGTSGGDDEYSCDIDHDDGEPYYDSNAEIYLEMEDEAGNSDTSDTRELGFDSRPPRIITFESVSGVSVFNEDFDMSYEALDNVAGVDYIDYTVDGSDGVQINESSANFTVDTSGLERGSYEVEAQAVDNLGKIGSSSSFEFDFYPDEVPELGIDAPESLNLTEGNTETVDVTITNTGRILVPDGTLEVSGLSASVSFDQVLPGESQTVGLAFSPSESDLGEHQVELSVSNVDSSVEIDVLVAASESTREDIQSEADTHIADYESLSQDVESLRNGLSQERADRLDEDFSTFETSVQELESAIENEEYYRADEILEDLDGQMQSAQTTFDEVQEEQRVADRNRMIVFAFVLLFAVLGGGAGFLVYSDDYEFDLQNLKELAESEESDEASEDTGYDHTEEDEEEKSIVDKIKSKIQEIKGGEEEASDEPEYEFK